MNTNKVTNLIMQNQVMQKKISVKGKANLTPAVKAKVNDYENLFRTVSVNFQKQINGDTAVDKFLGDPNDIKLSSSIAEVGAINTLSELIAYGDKIIKELDI